MNLTTWNVNSIRARLERTLEWVDAMRPDVLCVQELKCQDTEFPRQAFLDRGYHVAVFGQKTYNGVAILSLRPMEEVEVDLPWPGDPQARGIRAMVDGLQVVNLYVVNGGTVDSDKYRYKLEWLDRLRDWLRPRLDRPTVVCGDFNIAPADRDCYDPKGWEGQTLVSVPERQRFQALLALGLHDALRRFHDGPAYTWWDYRMNAWPQDHGLRIDHHLVTDDVLARATDVSVDREARGRPGATDHAPVTLHLRP